MSIAIEDINDSRKKITVTVPYSEVADEEKKLLADFAKHAKLPGFRPGKAPVHMIRAKYAKDIQNELDRKVSSVAYSKVSSDEQVDVYSIVDFEPASVKKDQDTEVQITVDVRPKIENITYKEIPVEIADTEVSEEEVEAGITSVREQRAQYEVAERAVEKGDFVKCSYEATLDGESIDELVKDKPVYGSQKTTWEEAGTEHSHGVQSISDALVGMAVEDKKDVEHSFADDFEVEALAGKTVKYSIEVQEIREKILPEINEEFLKAMNFESEEDMKEKTKERLVQEKEYSIENEKREQISKALLDSPDFPLPESAIQAETENYLYRMVQQNAQRGVSQEDMEENKEQLHEQAKNSAQQTVKLNMILEYIASEEKIKPEQEDFSRIIMQEAMMSRTSPEKLVKELKKDQDRMDKLRQNVLIHKTLDFVSKEATVSVTKSGE